MIIAVPKETQAGEKRVALSPDVVKSLQKAGFQCHIEQNAGLNAHFLDPSYQDAGATLVPDPASLYREADVVLKVNPPHPEEVALMNPEAILISFMYAHTNEALVRACLNQKISSFAMDAIPRISRAQKMDAPQLAGQPGWLQSGTAGRQCPG